MYFCNAASELGAYFMPPLGGSPRWELASWPATCPVQPMHQWWFSRFQMVGEVIRLL